MWKIDKQFEFCYGHRVWVQKLNHDFCAKGDTKTKCRHVHGHEGKVHVFLESDELNPQGMVTDFKHLGWLKNFIDEYIDHKFIIDRNDPDFKNLIRGEIISDTDFKPTNDKLRILPLHPVVVPGTRYVVGHVLDTFGLTGTDEEFFEGQFIVDFVPTSENLSKWLFEVVDAKMSTIDVKTTQIDWFETPKSRSTYTRPV